MCKNGIYPWRNGRFRAQKSDVAKWWRNGYEVRPRKDRRAGPMLA
jgi:hypothetical protein